MSQLKLHFHDEGSKVHVTLYRGEAWSDEKKEIVDQTTLDANDLPDSFTAGEEVFSLKQYGLKKIVQDRSSDEKDKAEKFTQIKATFEQLKEGIWRVASERGEGTARGSKTVDPFLAAAVAEVGGKSILEVSAALLSMTKEKRKAVMEHPKVAEVYARLKSETQNVDLGLD